MSASAVSPEAPRPSVGTAAWSLPSRAVATFSGPIGIGLKIALLSLSSAIGIWALVVLVNRHSYTAAALVAAVTVVIDALYFLPRAVPAKFLIPGTFFLIAFQVIPIAYTLDVTFTRVTDGAVFHDNGRGSFVHDKEELLPGWKVYVGFRNFGRIIHSKLIRGPFVRVFIWTLAFATLTVFLSFGLGLFLAITLNKAGMRFRGLYRSALILPYAIPGFLSLLVWRGLLNDDFGVMNKLLGNLGIHIPFLFDANWAKVSVIIVSTWLTVPYFFIVSLGALQSIPGELIEAARVDGASAWDSFRKVTLPLL